MAEKKPPKMKQRDWLDELGSSHVPPGDASNGPLPGSSVKGADADAGATVEGPNQPLVAPGNAQPTKARDDSHEVPQVARAFAYQEIYAALKSLALNSSDEIGLEHLDDVSINGRDGIDLIQVKDESRPLTDYDDGLWTSLAKWAALAAESTQASVQYKKFIFTTTAPLGDSLPTRLKYNASPHKTTIAQIIECLSRLSSTEQKLNDKIQFVRSLDPKLQHQFWWKVCIEQAPTKDELIAKLREALRGKGFEHARLDEVMYAFVGKFRFNAWKQLGPRHGARFTFDTISEWLGNLHKTYTTQTIPHRFGLMRIDVAEREAHRDAQFCQQLRLIGLDQEWCDNAVLDFLRNQQERHVWMTHLEFQEVELLQYDQELVQRWNYATLRLESDSHANDDKPKFGKRLYSNIMTADPPVLRNLHPEGHVYRGSYQALANEKPPQVGWHPDWKSHFSNPDEKSDSSNAETKEELNDG